jgi:hypothetical protein
VYDNEESLTHNALTLPTRTIEMDIEGSAVPKKEPVTETKLGEDVGSVDGVSEDTTGAEESNAKKTSNLVELKVLRSSSRFRVGEKEESR